MEPFWLVGEPTFRPGPREEYFAPVGQADLCVRVLQETKDSTEVIPRLREEYLSIVWMLKQMEIELRILYAHEDLVDQQALSICVEVLQCKLAGFPGEYFPPSIIYPRDLSVLLPGTLLVNSQVVRTLVERKGGYEIIGSPYGEGGRVLHSRDVVLVSERMIHEEMSSYPADEVELKRITPIGTRVGLLPPPVVQVFTRSGLQNRLQCNDHMDRVGCLIFGKDGNLHLVVDPQMQTINWRGTKATPWTPVGPRETFERLIRICDPLGVTVHRPRETLIPYSLNLLQFPDGRVLMTGGDEPVAEVISEIVGEKNIFSTPTPIRYLPTWAYAGIRCIVNEAPLPLLMRA